MFNPLALTNTALDPLKDYEKVGGCICICSGDSGSGSGSGGDCMCLCQGSGGGSGGISEQQQY